MKFGCDQIVTTRTDLMYLSPNIVEYKKDILLHLLILSCDNLEDVYVVILFQYLLPHTLLHLLHFCVTVLLFFSETII